MMHTGEKPLWTGYKQKLHPMWDAAENQEISPGNIVSVKILKQICGCVTTQKWLHFLQVKQALPVYHHTPG